MTRQTGWLLGGVAVTLLVWLVTSPVGDERVVFDFLEEFPQASDERPSPEIFSLIDATLGGETHRAVLVREPSRLVYDLTVPDDGVLRVSLGLQESEWDTEGDGVLFRILVGANTPPEEVLNVMVDPYHRPADRAWLPFSVDLSEYAGEAVRVFFNTNPSAPADPPVDDRRGDLALWGEPRVVAR
jgi:hypothetical protein